MRSIVIIALSIAFGSVAAAGSVQIDGITVYGRLQDVSQAEIREAIDGNGPIDKPHEIEVISSSEMHAYYSTRELGWTPVRRIPTAWKTYVWRPWGLSVYEPNVLQIIRTAEKTYIFPVPNPLKPHRDNEHLRILDGDAQKKLVRLIGDQHKWWQQAYHLVVTEPAPPDIGVLFKHGTSEVILFFTRGCTEGTIDGQHISGLLDDMGEQLQKWKHRYAQAELATKKV